MDNVNCLNQSSGQNHQLYHGDCVDIMKGLPDESVHCSIFSPPFAALYVYSDSDRDMGNCLDENQFFAHFTFAVEQLYRIMKPGRVVCVHCMDLPRLKQKDGWIGVYEFPDDLRRCFKEHGFHYDGQCTIWKNPVTAMTRTKSIRLLHKQMLKDSTVSGWALPEYILKFKKPGENQEPVAGEFDRWVGEDGFLSTQVMSVDIWQEYASPVWMDIRQTRTLQCKSAKGEQDERHICPLHLDVIDRCLQLWSNPGDVVFDPFGGIASVPYCAIKMDRKGLASELKESYYLEAVKNCRRAENELREQWLLDHPVIAKAEEGSLTSEGFELAATSESTDGFKL